MRFEEKTVLITGGGSGIGRAAALRFAELGARVCVIGRREEALAQTAELAGSGCEYRVGDVSEEATIASIVGSFERIDVFVSNAAVSYQTPLTGCDPSWREMMDINLLGSVYGCLAAGNKMLRDNTEGRIVIVSSILGQIAEAGSTAYGMAKAALNQFTRQLAGEWSARGILVNAVAPGFVQTPMSSVSGEDECESDWFKHFYINPDRPRIPQLRPGRPEEIAECILFFANPLNSYCSGQVLVADGGLTIQF